MRIIKDWELIGLIEQQTDIAKVWSTFDDSIIIHASLIHDMNWATDDQTHVFGVAEGLLDYRQLQFIEKLAVLVIFLHGVVIRETGGEDDLSLEVHGAVFKKVLELDVF